MKTLIKQIFIALFFIFIAVHLHAQTWINNYDFSGSYSGYDITQIQFINPNTGWLTLQNNNNVKIMRSTNKGRDWSQTNSYDVNNAAKTFFVFNDELHGYKAHEIHDQYGDRTILDKTTDGGYSWNRKINYIQWIAGAQPVIYFKNSSEGYLFIIGKYNPWQVRVFRTYDSFENSSESYSFDHPYNIYFELNDVILGPSNNMVGIGNDSYIPNGLTCYYRILGDGVNFSNSYGTNFTQLRFLYGAFINSNLRYLGVEADYTSSYPGTRFYTDVNYGQNSILIDGNNDYRKIGGLTFSNDSKGFTTVDDKVYITTNSGNNWTQEATLNTSAFSSNGHHRVKSFGDVCYTASSYGKFYTRLLGMNLNTNFDWQGGISGSITVDGSSYNTPSTQNLRGGTTPLWVNNQYIISYPDTTAKFYYWGGICNGSMNLENNVYFVNSGGDINADYKSKQVSNIPEALKYSTQVKTIKDTNGVINILYESMGGGLFYTRTRKSDAHFKAEEFVSCSGYRTYNNKNAMLTEIKPRDPGSSVIDGEKNMCVVWERREESNIKIINAGRNIIGPFFDWDYLELFSINNAPENFEAFPKLFVSQHTTPPPNPTIYELKVVTYLKPDGSNKKIVGWVKASNGATWEYDLTSAGIISEYAVSGIGGIQCFFLYITYRKDQTVYYKQVKLGQANGAPYMNVIDEDIPVSNDVSQHRASLDIGVKDVSSEGVNLQPVISYQGRINTKIVLRDGDGTPTELQGYYYPIYVRERLSSGVWSPSTVSYTTTLNTVQQTPSLIASISTNSCILSYDRGSTHLKVIPRWHGYAPNSYTCSPNQFVGVDARLLKGSLLNTLSYTDTTMTLGQSGSIYNIDRQRFSVTNQSSTNDGSTFDGVTGIVTDDNIKYSFNLGSIMVNSNLIGFSSDIDTTIGDGGELNEQLTSLPFLLNDDDTLIIGRNASYIDEGDGNFTEVQYTVYLTNNSTDEKFLELARDTVHAGDSIQVEYLEGFIIQNIPQGSDSFYVQMEIDTIWSGDGDDFGLNNISNDESGEGDNTAMKRYIFWKNVNVVTNNIPTAFNLYQNFPNPFNPLTKIKYDLPKNVNVTVKVYDLIGREVAVLVNNEFKTAGRYEINWNATNFASGVYIYRIQSGDYVSTKKMVLVK